MDSDENIKETTEQKGDINGTSNDGNQQHTDKIPLANSKDNLFSHKFLFGVIFSRCRDVSATVRAKVSTANLQNNKIYQSIIFILIGLTNNWKRLIFELLF